MTVKLSTTIKNIERDIPSLENREIILQFLEFMKRTGTSEKYQNNNLKAITAYGKFLGATNYLHEVHSKRQILSFLDTKVKSNEIDPDNRWITTWNDYLGRIKFFFRWVHNCKDKDFDDITYSDWEHLSL